jgi:hypothetical protein
MWNFISTCQISGHLNFLFCLFSKLVIYPSMALCAGRIWDQSFSATQAHMMYPHILSPLLACAYSLLCEMGQQVFV